jgi:hypothetical protein
MTHFIGAVIVPANVNFDLVRTPTPFPELYGKDGLDTEPTQQLSEYLNRALAPFDENKEVEYWKSKAEIIAEGHESIENYAKGTYATYLADPAKYAVGVTNHAHLDYLANEFPLKLQWTDEQIYQDALRFEEFGDVREDGAVRQTYNPLSKWDWWTIGGRWEEAYRDRQGEKVSDLLKVAEQALIDVRDPANIAELDEVEAYIEEMRKQFREQQTRTQTWYAENPELRTNSADENWAKANDGVVEKIITFKDLDAAEAKKLDCKGYLPWWFPFHLVSSSMVPHVNEQGEAVYDSEGNEELVEDWTWHQQGRMGWFGMKSDEMGPEVWVEKLIEILKEQDQDARLVYIDFHI